MRNLLKDNIELMKEYNYAKNVDLDLDKITIGTKKKIWWKCSLGHEWQSAVGSRSNGVGCPYCSNRKVLRGYNDLASTNPNVANEWDYEKNIGLLPTMISSGSNKTVWWKCSLGHEWQAVVVERAIRGTGCPYCANQKVLVGFNDLATKNPAIASEWDYSKNQELLPTMVPPGSLKRVWWKCSLGHEWQEIIEKRAIRGYGCPVCSGHKVLAGYNDLATVYPDVAKEWHPIKNTDISPFEVTPFSGRKVWWICRKGHEWQARIYDRTSKKTGCPICNQELKTSFPEQAILFYCRMLTSAESRYVMDYNFKNSFIAFMLNEQTIHDQMVIFGTQENNGILPPLQSHKMTVIINKSTREFVAPRNCWYCISSEGAQCVILPISPHCALELAPEGSSCICHNGGIDRLFHVDDPDDVAYMNNNALQFEYAFNHSFIASSSKEELFRLQEYCNANRDFLETERKSLEE